jgi:enolase
MTLTLSDLRALEILDSRGRPTLAVEATLSDGTRAVAQVPSGASTGRHEAHELRDGGPWYAGKGVRSAARHVTEVFLPSLRGIDATDQAALDHRLIAIDGTPNKARYGANATLGISCAVARAVSVSRKEPLYRTLAPAAPKLPRPMINILSGGLHAGGNVEFQDFLIVPHGFSTMAEALEATVRIHATTGEILRRSGYTLTGVADEGGWGPLLPSNEEALFLLTVAIAEAGYLPGDQVSIALDVAASHFYREGAYHLASERRSLTSREMVELLARWCASFPIVSIEDGLAEDDWEGWTLLTERLGHIQLVGDDLFTTNVDRLRQGIAGKAANCVLVKMNQIGTLTETFAVCELARQSGYRAVVSARSGETEDSFLADLATATGAGQIKIGSITRSERLAKYNRLLEIEAWDGLTWGSISGD